MKYVTQQSGFSLVEALVAISLLLLVVVGPMQILKQSSNSTKYASEQMTAYFLAQEGIELVHARRDDLMLHYFRGQFGGAGITDPMGQMDSGVLGDCFTAAQGCGLYISDAGDLTSVNCSSAGNLCRLNEVETGRSRYTHATPFGHAQSPYFRRVQLREITNAGRTTEFEVTSTIEWRTGTLLGGQRVQLVTYLQNVYDTD